MLHALVTYLTQLDPAGEAELLFRRAGLGDQGEGIEDYGSAGSPYTARLGRVFDLSGPSGGGRRRSVEG